MPATQAGAAVIQYIDRFSIADVAPLRHSNCEEWPSVLTCIGRSHLEVKKRAYLDEEVGVERPASLMFRIRSISTLAARRIRKTPFSRTKEVPPSMSLPGFERVNRRLSDG
jgi:hypothetical protein